MLCELYLNAEFDRLVSKATLRIVFEIWMKLELYTPVYDTNFYISYVFNSLTQLQLLLLWSDPALPKLFTVDVKQQIKQKKLQRKFYIYIDL